MSLLDALRTLADTNVDKALVEGTGETFSAAQLLQRSAALAEQLKQSGARRIASLMDNGPAWLLLDLAVQRLGLLHVPLPIFFHPQQIAHALHSAGVDLLITDRAMEHFGAADRRLAEGLCGWSLKPTSAAVLPEHTAVITFTSGTTGQPKGVCLSSAMLHQVASSLVELSRDTAAQRHLCLLPLGVLLEQVAGLHAALLAGAQVLIPPLATTGLSGASGVDGQALANCLRRHRAHSAILLPQMLDALCSALESGARALPDLRFLAVGGARVAPAAMSRARALGLPVYQGYGLSEVGSVACLERPGAQRAGSVGRVLPGRSLRVDDQDQLWIEGNCHLGYLGQAPFEGQAWPTGDLGYIDADGFVYLRGRISEVLITAYGRNVSPEWIESELIADPMIQQSMVCGEAEAWLQAVIVPANAAVTDEQLQAAVDRVNERLPDYARLGAFVRCAEAFSAADGLLTANGRLRRDALQTRFAARLDALWDAVSPPQRSLPTIVATAPPCNQLFPHQGLMSND